MTYVRASNTKKSLLWIPTGKKENISENIIRQIIDAIKAKEISPCDKIQGEIELAAKFGVSRNSVREALNALTWFGVLEKETRVRNVSVGAGPSKDKQPRIDKVIKYRFINVGYF